MPNYPPPKVGPRNNAVLPSNNAHHWKDWQKRHRMPRPIDLLIRAQFERAKEAREKTSVPPKSSSLLDDDFAVSTSAKTTKTKP